MGSPRCILYVVFIAACFTCGLVYIIGVLVSNL